MKSKKFFVTIFVFLCLILAGLGVAYAYIMTDLFKTPEQLFFKYLKKNVDQVEGFVQEPLKEIYSRFAKENSKVVMEVSSKYEEKNYNVSLTASNDINNKIFSLGIDSSIDDSYILGLNLLLSNSALAIQNDDLTGEDYYVIENRNLKNLAKNFMQSDEAFNKVPDTISIPNIDYSKLNEIAEEYVMKAYNELTVKEYSVENVSVTMDDASIDAKKISLKMDFKEVYSTFLKNYKEIVTDQRIQTMLKETMTEEDIAYICNQIYDGLSNIEKNIIASINNNDIIISVYVNKGNTIKTTFDIGENYIYDLSIYNDKIYIESTYLDEEQNRKEIKNEITKNYQNDPASYMIEEINEDGIECSTIVAINKTTDNVYNFTYKANSKDEEMNEALSILNQSMKIEFGGELGLQDKLSSGIVINDYTEEEILELCTKILNHEQEFVQKNTDSFIGNIIAVFAPLKPQVESDVDGNFFDTTTTTPTVNDSDNEDDFKFSTIDFTTTYISDSIKSSINKCLDSYKIALESDANANMADYLNINNIQKNCDSNYKLELIDGSTIRVTDLSLNEIYIASVIYNENLLVESVNVVKE